MIGTNEVLKHGFSPSCITWSIKTGSKHKGHYFHRIHLDEDDKPAQSVAQLAYSEPVVLDVKVRETQKVSR